MCRLAPSHERPPGHAAASAPRSLRCIDQSACADARRTRPSPVRADLEPELERQRDQPHTPHPRAESDAYQRSVPTGFPQINGTTKRDHKRRSQLIVTSHQHVNNSRNRPKKARLSKREPPVGIEPTTSSLPMKWKGSENGQKNLYSQGIQQGF